MYEVIIRIYISLGSKHIVLILYHSPSMVNEYLYQKAEPSLRSLTRYTFTDSYSTFNDFTPVQFLVQSHQNNSEERSAADGDKGGDAIDDHGNDYALY